MKLTKFLAVSMFLLTFLFSTKSAHAVYNPLDVPNNRFGIHIMHEHDLDDAAELVNSSGGEWGYVTLVIRQDERNLERWQRVFDEMRRKKLIPIVRIATVQAENGWIKFDREDINNWVYFLNSLNWVVKNRYVIVGNEPNHASEWGGDINPEEYADFLYEFSKTLKNSSNDFFVIPAGFDASAPNAEKFLSEPDYLRRMVQHKPEVFDYVDGWSSHSYPNPGFSGSVHDTGRGTIQTYKWEKEYLRSLGIHKDFPIFITETGWAHNLGSSFKGLIHPDQVGENFKTAFENVWGDDVVAITPFIMSYQDTPFDIFSWIDKNGNFYNFYNEVKNLKKSKGQPIQLTKGHIRTVYLPENNNRNQMNGYIVVENTGQSIWDEGQINIINAGDSEIKIFNSKNLSKIEPGETSVVLFTVNIPANRTSEMSLSLMLAENEIQISDSYKISFPASAIAENAKEDDAMFNSIKTALPFVTFVKNDKTTNISVL